MQMVGVNPGGISWSNIGIIWDCRFLCIHVNKLIISNKAKMVNLWVKFLSLVAVILQNSVFGACDPSP